MIEIGLQRFLNTKLGSMPFTSNLSTSIFKPLLSRSWITNPSKTHTLPVTHFCCFFFLELGFLLFIFSFISLSYIISYMVVPQLKFFFQYFFCIFPDIVNSVVVSRSPLPTCLQYFPFSCVAVEEILKTKVIH